MIEFEAIKKSNYISNAIMISDMSLKFETLYLDNRVQAFFKNQSINKDFLACQALMSPALFKMLNARCDFTLQKAFIKEQTINMTLNLTDESLVSVVEEKCKELKETTIVKKLSNKFEFLVKPGDIDNFKKVFNDHTKY